MRRGDEGQFLMRRAESEAAVALRKRRAEGLALMKAGLTNAEVMAATGAPLGTVKQWRNCVGGADAPTVPVRPSKVSFAEKGLGEMADVPVSAASRPRLH